MIVEGLITTTAPDGLPHVAPMGPVVNENKTEWLLRPFQSSTSFSALYTNPNCVFHVIDDVLPLVQLLVRKPHQLELSPLSSSEEYSTWLISSACSWYHLHVDHWNTDQPRAEATASLVDHGELRPFWGWNRAKHAVLEAAILATRMHIIEASEIRKQYQSLSSAVEKTAGPREQTAWELLNEFVKASFTEAEDD